MSLLCFSIRVPNSVYSLYFLIVRYFFKGLGDEQLAEPRLQQMTSNNAAQGWEDSVLRTSSSFHDAILICPASHSSFHLSLPLHISSEYMRRNPVRQKRVSPVNRMAVVRRGYNGIRTVLHRSIL
jgi:hypothetical protein